MTAAPRTFRPDTTHVWANADGSAEPVEVTPTFWQELMRGERPIGQWLLAVATLTESLPNWDLHPRGACIVVLLSGSIDVEWHTANSDIQAIPVAPLEACLIPRRIWHRVVVHEPSMCLSLTAGEGTRLRPVKEQHLADVTGGDGH
jgi:hypothetical protein